MGTRSATAATPRPSSSDPAEARRPAAAAAAGAIAQRGLTGSREPIHGPVAPAEVRAGDPVLARVHVAGAGEVPAQVWRISPFAVEVVRTPALGDVVPGDALDLALRIGTSTISFPAARVVAAFAERGRELIALRWSCTDRDAAAAEGDRRVASRWVCGDEYVPTGVAENAARYDDLVHFRIAEISSTGMRLLTSLRNKFLVPGVQFVATCAFPTVGATRVEFRIVHARVVQQGGKRWLALGVTYAIPDANGNEILGQYLLQFGEGATVQRLKSTGFRVRSSSRALEFGCVSSEEEYHEVLALRRLAYVHAGKVSAEIVDEDMADALDASSRIVVAKHRGRVVATVRLYFPRGPASRLKHEDFLALPPGFPARDDVVEFSKFCTDPEFRGSDLFYTLVKRCALSTMQSGRRYALMSCTASLAPAYARVGFRKVAGGSYVHPTMHLEHDLMIGDVARIVSGKHVNPVVWNLMGGWELWTFAKRCGVAPQRAWLEARVALWRLFKPLARAAAALYVWRKGSRGWRA
jgi:predicted GNAT family N-acyltransferase